MQKMILWRFSRPSLSILGTILWTLATAAAAQDAAIVVRNAQGATIAHSGEVATLGAWRVPPAAQMVFDVRGAYSGLNYSATGQLAWLPKFQENQANNPTAQSYEARLQVQLPLLGARSQSSEGRIGIGGLQPLVFIDRSRREYVTTLDADRSLVRFARSGEQHPMAALTQDRVSVFFELAGLLHADASRYSEPGTAFTFTTASRSNVQNWVFRVVGIEQLALPAGRMRALKLERTRQDSARGQHTASAGLSSAVWLAPEIGYLPVRIRLSEDDGDTVDLQLQSLAPQP